MSVNTKFGKRTKILSELSNPESLDGSPTDSETRKQAIKARETRLTRKQSVPQGSHHWGRREKFFESNFEPQNKISFKMQIQQSTHQ